MTDITNPHDRCFAQLMADTHNARAFFQRYLSAELLAMIDLDTLTLQEGSKVTQAFQQLHMDVLYQVDFKASKEAPEAHKGYLYCLVEHQSTPDPAMAVRLWQYKAALLLNHVQDDYLPPIHSLVFYHGQPTPYPHSLDLRSRFRTPQQAEDTLQEPPQLIDLGQQPDKALLTHDSAGLFSYFFKHVRDGDVYPALEALPEDLLRSLAQEPWGFYTIEVLMRYYQIQANTQAPLKAFKAVADKLALPQQKEVIMTIGEALLQQGRQEGRQEGTYEVAANMLKAGLEVTLVQSVTGLSLEQIQKLDQESAKPSSH